MTKESVASVLFFLPIWLFHDEWFVSCSVICALQPPLILENVVL